MDRPLTSRNFRSDHGADYERAGQTGSVWMREPRNLGGELIVDASGTQVDLRNREN
jgi:hypothetical protein